MIKDKGVFNVKSFDYDYIIGNLDNWWGGRSMTAMLPRLFVDHFSTTSFVMKDHGKIVGFIIGFLSQDDKGKAYVHFIDVDPEYRGKKIGCSLYAHFFEVVRELGVQEVSCVTSPQNKSSIKFHEMLGFVAKPGNDNNEEGKPYTSDYDGPGESRVVFSKRI